MNADHYHPILLALTEAERKFESHRATWTPDDDRLYLALRTIRAEVLKRESGHPFPDLKMQPVLSQPTAKTPATVLIVDDEPEMRGILQMIVGSTPDLRVVGEAHNGIEAIEAAVRLRPDVILMDVNMPEMDGFEAARYLRRIHPWSRVIILN
jgi:PleD family two-component response regulator